MRVLLFWACATSSRKKFSLEKNPHANPCEPEETLAGGAVQPVFSPGVEGRGLGQRVPAKP